MMSFVEDKQDKTLLKKLGGEVVCRRLAKEFYSRVAGDVHLKPLFPGKSLRCATEEFAAFLIQFLGGDEEQTQYRWWLSLSESHTRFHISDNQKRAWLSHMNGSVDTLFNDPHLREELKRFFGTAAAYVVDGEQGEVEPGELGLRWTKQLMLDELITNIATGRQAEAISTALLFSSRRSVFVGILHRMMIANRNEFTEFVLQSVGSDPEVGSSRFNGRSLLHLAAGAGCLSVVRLVLSQGTDPNLLDSGGHTPLYRSAGSPHEADGAEIVRELVRAGATIDHCGGVNRSTALHEAARHGSLEVAKALLEAGASVTSRDKKGLSPLDRARNCRRHELVALLRSAN
jgi:truncated hemoglobin YjbI